jgi:hypothetical protein
VTTATARVLCLLFGTALLWIAEPQSSHAQDDGARPGARRPHKTRVKPKPKAAEPKPKRERSRTAIAGGKPARTDEKPSKPREAGPAASPSAVQAAQAAAAGVDAEIVKEGDTSVKVMKFTGLGIEGRLKSPQLVYFVQRVRAEFERPELPHRSFMPELERTTAREPVR